MTYRIKFSAIILGAGAAVAAFAASHSAARPDQPAAGFAVVELFTSEGCSSCPPADAALGDLIRDSKGKPVYALAFHVDYWNDLGWADRYSSKAFSERQQQYSRALKLDSIYTPQAIVNGQDEFVGSHRDLLKSAVASALAVPALGTLEGAAKASDGGIQVDAAGTGLDAGTIVNVALVEDGIVSKVTRGENSNHTLAHEHVVRSFASGTLAADGHITLTIPLAKEVDVTKASIILYAQRPADLHVLAAAEIGLPK